MFNMPQIVYILLLSLENLMVDYPNLSEELENI